MGHLVGKDIYRDLGRKIDGLSVRTPWNDTLHQILRELYSAEEADVVVRMPYRLSRFEKIVQATGYDRTRLRNILEALAEKGLVIDLQIRGRGYYMPSPMVIGIFEFTMMRTGGDLDMAGISRLFSEYMEKDDIFWAANFAKGEKVSVMRTVPWEDTIRNSERVEVLDYEKAAAIIGESDRFAVGLCSCRHKKHHSGEKECDVPTGKCSTLGRSADYMIRHNLAGEVSRTEMLENLAESREMALVINADNVRDGCEFMCHCCGCCCQALGGISRHGYPNTVVTSSFIARWDKNTCNGCGACAKACTIDAIEMVENGVPDSGRKADPMVDESICLGCGVCALKCRPGSMKLVKRDQRVIHPENIFQRLILQSLERGTLQNQLFPEPENMTHAFMRGLVGGVLKLPPVKAALMSDLLRSRFLETIQRGARI
ncbi:MAG: 4Fe-4S dicluster domain-containing protein [Deltaproteobacteria bacterium]|nr:4Fe-4S dicluster domain-containing protein [Deltaproteobacteria bacterium]